MATIAVGQSDAFVSDKAIEKKDLGGGIRRKILGYGPDLMIVKVWFDRGSIGEVHAHRHCQSSYVESGKFEVFVDGEKRVLSAGDCFYIAPHLDHGAVCIEPGVLIDTFSPAREDFLGMEG
uniref:cupin domain-containing protein n=1 Tax=uncultured Altererythrobacter sp. TaxID=500840 RepID=UPI00262EAD62|nr:cupin domain-containing protein [uncultured Altererythrobacter sp.]